MERASPTCRRSWSACDQPGARRAHYLITETLVDEFEASLPFKLDAFQREAIEKLDLGHGGVLVSAPTSSGKTIVAEYAIYRALKTGLKVLYTTPLKALSNQKYHDFVREYGESTVGLVTGENTINDEAPVVVMTTEILRNLIYEDPKRLDMVRYVVLDEVHYIDDFPRGSVWEEIVIQAPQSIQLVGLSATIGNYKEIADWMAENRGGMETVFHDVRPVELKMWLAINNRFLPLFKGDGGIDQRTWTKAADEEALFRRMVDSRLLRRGLAEHHAGLLPYHKEMVEELFQRGLIKVVFATETLSLGINMPARGVVVSSFT